MCGNRFESTNFQFNWWIRLSSPYQQFTPLRIYILTFWLKYRNGPPQKWRFEEIRSNGLKINQLPTEDTNIREFPKSFTTTPTDNRLHLQRDSPIIAENNRATVTSGTEEISFNRISSAREDRKEGGWNFQWDAGKWRWAIRKFFNKPRHEAKSVSW